MYGDRDNLPDEPPEEYQAPPKNFVPEEYIEIKRESDKSWLIKLRNGANVFLPKSECQINKKDQVIYIPRWLAKRVIKNNFKNNKRR